jgi:hypothetical protein
MKMNKMILQVIYLFYNNIVIFDKNKKIDYVILIFGILYFLHNYEIIVLNNDFFIKPLLSLIIDRGIARIFLKLINIKNYFQINITYFSNPKMNLISEYILLLVKILLLPSIIFKLYNLCQKDISYNLLIFSIIPYIILAFYINSIQKK